MVKNLLSLSKKGLKKEIRDRFCDAMVHAFKEEEQKAMDMFLYGDSTKAKPKGIIKINNKKGKGK